MPGLLARLVPEPSAFYPADGSWLRIMTLNAPIFSDISHCECIQRQSSFEHLPKSVNSTCSDGLCSLFFDDESGPAARDELGSEKLACDSPAVPLLQPDEQPHNSLPPFTPAKSIVVGRCRHRRTACLQPASTGPKSSHSSRPVSDSSKRVEVFDGKHKIITWFRASYLGYRRQVLHPE